MNTLHKLIYSAQQCALLVDNTDNVHMLIFSVCFTIAYNLLFVVFLNVFYQNVWIKDSEDNLINMITLIFCYAQFP